MESVIDGMALHVGNKACNINDSQYEPFSTRCFSANEFSETTLREMFQETLTLFQALCDNVGNTLRDVQDWGPSGLREGQYSADLLADQVVLEGLANAGLSVLSEESGLTMRGSGGVVIVDPLDGSTNASQGLAWYATSLCLIDDAGAAVAMVRNQANGHTFTATRGGGAWRDGQRIVSSGCTSLSAAVVGLSGLPRQHYGWKQFRAYGAAALDLCMVASGVLDGFVDCSVDAHGVWDYAAGVLICTEAGAVVEDALGRELLVRDPALRRTPVAGSSPAVLDALLTARALSFAD